MAGEISLIRMEQGATALTVPSSCIIEVESGGSIDLAGHLDIESAGYITLESGGYIDVDDGGYIQYPVVADTSSANLSNFGVSKINVDSSAPTTFTMDAPIPGVVKYIYVDDGVTDSGIAYVSAGVPIASSASSTNSFLRIAELDARAALVGLTTSKWLLVYKSTGVTVTTGTT